MGNRTLNTYNRIKYDAIRLIDSRLLYYVFQYNSKILFKYKNRFKNGCILQSVYSFERIDEINQMTDGKSVGGNYKSLISSSLEVFWKNKKTKCKNTSKNNHILVYRVVTYNDAGRIILLTKSPEEKTVITRWWMVLSNYNYCHFIIYPYSRCRFVCSWPRKTDIFAFGPCTR